MYIYRKYYIYNLYIKNFRLHQLKRDYALNLNISVSAVQKKKLTMIPLVTASEVGNTSAKSFWEISQSIRLSPLIKSNP